MMIKLLRVPQLQVLRLDNTPKTHCIVGLFAEGSDHVIS